VRPGLDVPTTRRLHACHQVKAPSCARWNCRREKSGNFAQMPIYTLHFRDLLHAVKLRHGTDGFTFPPKEGVLGIIFRPKNSTAFAGCEPANFGTKGQHATSRPPKPLGCHAGIHFTFAETSLLRLQFTCSCVYFNQQM
jgi:hypothetical protein